MAKKSPAKRKDPDMRIKGIANPSSGLPANVRAMMPAMTTGVLCFASGTAGAVSGYNLTGVYCHVLAGQDNEEDPADTISQGRQISLGNNPNWSSSTQLAAYLPSSTNALGWNTLNVAYTYIKDDGSLQSTIRSEFVSFKGKFIQQCPSPPAVVANSLAARTVSVDLLPSRISGHTYVYKNVPVNQIGGVRLMKNARTPLQAELLEVAATRVDWTPDGLSHPRLHRPIGPMDYYTPSNPLSPVCRFRTKPRNSIVMYQDSAAAYALIASDKKHPDILEFNNSSLDLMVQVNDLVENDPGHSPARNFYTNNEGSFDLWIKVLRP